MDRVKDRPGQPGSPMPGAGGGNPIQAWLDACGVPWRDRRGELVARYGVTQRMDGGYAAVEVDLPRKPIQGLIRPLRFQLSDYFSPSVPATEWMGEAYYEPDESANIHRVADELEPFLGPVEIADHLNTLRATWAFDRARIRLLAWPRARQGPLSSRPRTGDRDPRLQLGCHVTVQTGFLLHPSELERDRIEWFAPICSLPPQRPAGAAGGWKSTQGELEFIREPSGLSGMADAIGLSSDRSMLIFQTTDLYVFRMSQVLAIHVERVRPAKGPGGSTLEIEVATDYPGRARKRVIVSEAAGPDDLNETGRLIAGAIGRPLKLSPYSSDS